MNFVTAMIILKILLQAVRQAELVSGNYEMGVSYDEGDEAQESFDFLLDNSPYV